MRSDAVTACRQTHSTSRHNIAPPRSKGQTAEDWSHHCRYIATSATCAVEDAMPRYLGPEGPERHGDGVTDFPHALYVWLRNTAR
jgi:hypothetical protein